MKKKLFLLAGIFGLGVAYWLISPLWRTVEMHDTLPGAEQATAASETGEASPIVVQPVILKQASLVAHAHEVEGSVLVVQTGEERILRFEKLKTINGPDLRIYLASDLDARDIVDLGPIRATEGEVNYPIPAGTDLEKYGKVLIWCRAFRVLFSAAEL